MMIPQAIMPVVKPYASLIAARELRNAQTNAPKIPRQIKIGQLNMDSRGVFIRSAA